MVRTLKRMIHNLITVAETEPEPRSAAGCVTAQLLLETGHDPDCPRAADAADRGELLHRPVMANEPWHLVGPTVPLATVYNVAEGLGLESGNNKRLSEAPTF